MSKLVQQNRLRDALSLVFVSLRIGVVMAVIAPIYSTATPQLQITRC